MTRFFAFFPLFFLVFATIRAQTPQDATIPVQVSTGLSPAAVLLSWTNPEPSDLKLRRREKGQAGNAWVTLVDAPDTYLNGYYDAAVEAGRTYEYAIERKTDNLTAYGFAYAALTPPIIDNRGKILIFIDSTSADQLGADLITYKNDLRGEGWQTIPFKTGPYTTVEWVKNQITNAYNADPEQVKAVLLLGNVPIPYSGSTAWDFKPDHFGAWPTDAYYGDVNGEWTDVVVNLPNTARIANRNVSGDHKWDQNTLPSQVELPVGRIDFRRLSAATFGLSPVELLRRYLLKNHRYRTGQFEVPFQAMVDDNLGWAGGEAFAADGYRNAYPLLGNTAVTTGDLLAQTNPQRYLMAYGAGSNGTYTSAGGIGTSADFAQDTVNTIFLNLFGDYFGDWDYENNPLLPATLAGKGNVLACGWAGRPHWMLHGLATGETLGFCLKETQNAQFNDAYGHSNSESGVHISLLGDPTLRAAIVKPASNLSAVSNCNKVNLKWTASPDPAVFGYLIYRAFDISGPYTRVTPNYVFGAEWIDFDPVADTLFYAVRAVKLESIPGGGAFYNTSTGVLQNVIFTPGTPPAVIGLGGVVNCTHPSVLLGSNSSPAGCNIQWLNPDGTVHSTPTTDVPGIYTVIATAPNGCSTVAYATVEIDTTLPPVSLPDVVTLNCTMPSASVTLPQAPAGVHFTWNGVEAPAGSVQSITGSVILQVYSDVNGCSKTYFTSAFPDFAPPGADASSDGHNLDCAHSFVQLLGYSNPSAAQFSWSGAGQQYNTANPVVIYPGTYCLTVTGTNGCISTDCITVIATGEAVTLQIGSSSGLCNTGDSITLNALVSGGTGPFQFNWSNGANTPEIGLSPGFSGDISLQVIDAHQCIGNANWSIGAPLEAFALKTNPSTALAADGVIDLIPFGGIQPYTFLWSNGSTEEDLVDIANGDYTVTVTDAVGCTTTLSASLLTVGTAEAGDDIGIRVAPNPAGETVSIYLTNNELTRIVLTDITGRILLATESAAPQTMLEVQDLPQGIYLLQIQLKGKTKTVKLVVAR